MQRKLVTLVLLVSLVGCASGRPLASSKTLDLHPAEKQAASGLRAMTEPGTEGRIFYLHEGQRYGAADIETIEVVESRFGEPLIQINLTDAGRVRFERLTEATINRNLAIVIDGELVSAPKVMEKIASGSLLIHPSATGGDAQRLFRALTEE